MYYLYNCILYLLVSVTICITVLKVMAFIVEEITKHL